MPIDIGFTGRIKRSIQYERAMSLLTKNKCFFSQYSNIITISALIGFVNDKYEEVIKAAEPLLFENFTSYEKDIIDLLAYVKTKGDPKILSNFEKYTIFEGYANGGLPLLLRSFNINIDQTKEVTQTEAKELVFQYYANLVTNEYASIGEETLQEDLVEE